MVGDPSATTDAADPLNPHQGTTSSFQSMAAAATPEGIGYQPPPPDQLPQEMTPQSNAMGVPPEAICYNSGNEQMYPISGTLYNSMCKELGGANVRPIPDYIKNDKLRKKWLKRGENAILYFLYRKNHYRDELQKLADTPSCAYCCIDKPHGETLSPCLMCCNEWGSLCCCAWQSIGEIRLRLYAGVTSTQSMSAACCPGCCGGSELLTVIGERFTKMGVHGMESNSCYGCCCLTFCQPCVSVKALVMVRYLYFKRYGKNVTWESMTNEAGDCPEYVHYLTQLKDSAHHPHGRAQTTTHGRYGTKLSAMTDREWPLIANSAINDLGHEYYHLKGALIAHNKHWEGYHRIEM